MVAKIRRKKFKANFFQLINQKFLFQPRGFLPRELRILRSILVDNDDQEPVESFIESRDTLPRYSVNNFSPEIPYEFDGISDFEPKTNIRDKEYLRHSTLWSHQQLGDFIGISRDRVKPIKDEKQENQLPTYCNPPNPCPVGYTSKYPEFSYKI